MAIPELPERRTYIRSLCQKYLYEPRQDPDGLRYMYTGHFLQQDSHGNWTGIDIQVRFWARHPYLAMAAIRDKLNQGADPETLDGTTIN